MDDYEVIQAPSLPGPYRIPDGLLVIVGHESKPISGSFTDGANRLNFKSPVIPGWYQVAIPLESATQPGLMVVLVKRHVPKK